MIAYGLTQYSYLKFRSHFLQHNDHLRGLIICTFEGGSSTSDGGCGQIKLLSLYPSLHFPKYQITFALQSTQFVSNSMPSKGLRCFSSSHACMLQKSLFEWNKSTVCKKIAPSEHRHHNIWNPNGEKFFQDCFRKIRSCAIQEDKNSGSRITSQARIRASWAGCMNSVNGFTEFDCWTMACPNEFDWVKRGRKELQHESHVTRMWSRV